MIRFIAIEGLDGSGKSTQLALLRDYLELRTGFTVHTLHFPQMERGLWGDLIARFLRGELGRIGEVNPYLVALIYAEDRRSAAPQIRQWLAEGHYVIIDRYVCSNIAFQGAKTSGGAEFDALRKWILRLEYEEFGIPKPEASIFLDVPFSFTERVLQDKRSGSDRDYLCGGRDIHEADLSFQRRVRDAYLRQAEGDSSLRVVRCAAGDGVEMLPKEEVFEAVVREMGIGEGSGG